MNEPQSETRKAPRSRGQLFEEAAAWVEKMHGPDAEQYRPDHDAWLKLGALHPSAYDLATETYLMEHTSGNEIDVKERNPVGRSPTKPWALLFAAVAISAVAASWTVLRPGAWKRQRR